MESAASSRTARHRQMLLAALAMVWLVAGTVFVVRLEMSELGPGEDRGGYALRLGALLLQLLIAVSSTALLFWTRHRRSAERLERQHAAEFRQLFHDSSEAMFVVDAELVLVEVNDAGCRLIGYAREEILGQLLSNLVPPEELAARPMQLAALRAGERIMSERTLRRKDGTAITGEIAIQRLPDGRSFGLLRDVSKRQAVEKRLRLLSRALEESPAAMIITDASGQIEYVNPRFSRVTGWTLAEAIGLTPKILRSDRTSPSVYHDLWTTIRDGKEWRGELTNRRKNGELFPWLLSIHPILDAQGRVEHFLGVGEDATERRLAEQTLSETRAELHQAQKMDALGRLAGGVSHDFNNLLGIILGYSDLLAANLQEGAKGQEELAEIRKAALRASDLTRQLLAFSRRQVLAVRVVEVASLLDESRKMLSRLLPESIDFRLEMDANLWSVRADSTQLVQVLVNLAVNARDAMPLGGLFTIAAGNVELDISGAQERGLSAGDYVYLAVSDTGSGMPPDVVEHAFEPFFTTKGAEGGSGLGLATVYGIVQQLGGSVGIESSPEKGTTVRIHLPKAVRGESGERALAPPSLERQVRETVLVVEDLDPLRKLVQRMLVQLGYRVHSAASAKEALSIAGEVGVEIDLLLSDIVMPGMDGRDLARTLKALRPKLRIVLMTGYSDLFSEGSDAHDLGADAIVQKPFSRSQIKDVLAGVLQSSEEDGRVS